MVRPQHRVKKLESSIEEEACHKVLLELGIFSLKLKRVNEVGWPDRLFLLPHGKTLYVEFKRPNEEPRKNQVLIHARLRFFGHEIEVHDSVEGAVDAVRDAKRRALGTKAVHAARRKVAP